jgi:hypothetical protein
MRPPPAPACLATLAALAVAWQPAAAPAQPKPEPPKPTVITLRPAAAPVPALSVQLLPDRKELQPGNAAIEYHRAMQMLVSRRLSETRPRAETGKPLPESTEELISRWAAGPIGDIPREEARTKLAAYEDVLHEVDLGAHRERCDWQLEKRTEGFTLVIPEIQEMRALARLVVVRARLAILDGKTDEALHWVQNGMAMGRHTGNGEMLIQALVGVAIGFMSSHMVEDLIQTPAAPNLYWALTLLPRPYVDMGHSLEGERNVIDRYLPRLKDLETGPWSTSQVQRMTDDLIRNLSPLLGGPSPSRGGPLTLHETPPRLFMATMVAKVYPEARRELIARGRPASEVDAMPATQVAFIHSLRAYHAKRDDMYKWTLVPYWAAAPHLKRLPPHEAPIASVNPILAVIGLLEPAVNAARLAEVRIERQLDALRTIEAIRLYAAAHDGQLPASLDAITEVPVPIDPATGKPFAYTVSGATATLSGPVPPDGPDHPSYRLSYELTLPKAQ